MFDPAAWRDADNETRRVGFVVTLNVLSLYLGRRCYRLRWTGPWTKVVNTRSGDDPTYKEWRAM